MTLHICSSCTYKAHLSEKSSKQCPTCPGTLRPLRASDRLARNTKTVELMHAFNEACEVPEEEDWSADRHRPREAVS